MKNLIVILTLAISGAISSQTTIIWKDLQCEFDEVWSDEFNAVYMIPQFEQKMKELDGTVIRIKGLITPIEVISGYYILSKQRVNIGGCGVGYITPQYEMIELSFLNEPVDMDFDKNYLIEGTLVLNKDDILQLNYILKDARIMREVKN
jgi:hypothetical protein